MNHPSNAFDDSDSDEDEEEAAELYGSSDEEMFKNTEVSKHLGMLKGTHGWIKENRAGTLDRTPSSEDRAKSLR